MYLLITDCCIKHSKQQHTSNIDQCVSKQSSSPGFDKVVIIFDDTLCIGDMDNIKPIHVIF